MQWSVLKSGVLPSKEIWNKFSRNQKYKYKMALPEKSRVYFNSFEDVLVYLKRIQYDPR